MNILNLKDWIVMSLEESDHNYQVSAAYTVQPPACVHCGTVGMLDRFGKKRHTFLDLPSHGKRTGILVDHQRYRCKSCGRTFLQPLPDMDEKRLMTKRLLAYIQQESLRYTFVYVADQVGVDEKTVRNIFRDHVKNLEESIRFEVPRILGIDELTLLGKPRCVLTNIEQRTLVEMLPVRTKQAVTNHLMRWKGRENIEIVAMDMWSPYRDAVRGALPQATIVVDKFHVVRMANQALDRVRKNVRSGMSDKERRSLMRDRYVLLKRRHDLTDRDRLLMESWTAAIPVLGFAYHAKEDFFDIWGETSAATAMDRYDDWAARLDTEVAGQFSDVLTAMRNWRREIFNYFDLKDRVTNAYTEAFNGLARVANRNGRGYSFDVIRARMLFGHGIHKQQYRGSYRSDRTMRMFMEGASVFEPRDYGVPLSIAMNMFLEDEEEAGST